MEHLDNSIGSMTTVPVHLRHSFEVDFLSKIDGKRYTGRFTCKKLSIKDLSQLQVKKVVLNGGFHYDSDNPGKGVSEETDWTNHMLAHLEVAIIQAPLEWWDINNIYDLDLVIHVYKTVAKFEGTFDSPQQEAAVDLRSSQDDSGEKGQNTGAAGHVEKVGGAEVSPSVDP